MSFIYKQPIMGLPFSRSKLSITVNFQSPFLHS